MCGKRTRYRAMSSAVQVVIYVGLEKKISRDIFENKILQLLTLYTGCPTFYRPQHFFNNSNTNEDIAKKFEQEYVFSFTFLTQ
jgi:hypothetical protein